MLATEWC